MVEAVEVDGRGLTLEAVGRIAAGAAVRIAPGAWSRIEAGRAVVDDMVTRGEPSYGITTGFGSQKDYALQPAEMATFNRRVLTAHASFAPGEAAGEAVLRAALGVQLNQFATGMSGVRPELVSALVERLAGSDLPPVRLGCSVGASDIVALSQAALPLLEGRELGPKEAMSLLNSNSLTLGQGALFLLECRRLLGALDLAASLSLEGLRGNPGAWSAAVEIAHPQPGHRAAGHHLRGLMEGSALWHPGEPRFLQDPLSFRCVPQIHGALYAALAWAWGIWEAELNAVVDNPVIDLEARRPVSHGSMESTLLTLSLDAVRLAVAKVLQAGNERVHKLQWPQFSGLPVGLAAEAGASGGVQFLNIAHIATAKLAAATHAAQPVTTLYRGQICDGVEDVAGLAPVAVTEGERQAGAAWVAVTIEAIVASWAIRRRGLEPAGLGHGLRAAAEALTPLLPIGREGEVPFDLGPAVATFQDLAPAAPLV